MAYISVEADDRIEEGPERLEFKSFLGADTGGRLANGQGVRSSNVDRGYIQDESRQRTGSSGFWTIEYYQPYFDVDTNTVWKRCYSTLIPTSTSFLSTHLTPSPDLYGPFWTLTTLIFTLYLSSSLASSISSFLSSPDTTYEYNFGLLSISVSLVYAYGIGFPVLLWMALRYLGVGEWSIVEAVAVWGYAMFVWIPVSILCVIPVPILRWALVGVAFSLSCYFLIANVYPILSSAEAKLMRLFIIVIAALHAGLALTFKMLFFSYYVVKAKDPVPI